MIYFTCKIYIFLLFFLKLFSFFVYSAITLLKEGACIPPSDPLLKFLVESSTEEERAECANCDSVSSVLFSIEILELRRRSKIWSSFVDNVAYAEALIQDDKQCKTKKHSSAGNVCTMFYLYSNKNVGLVNVCILPFEYHMYDVIRSTKSIYYQYF